VNAHTTVVGRGVREAVAASKKRHPAATLRPKVAAGPAPLQFYVIGLVVALLTILGLVMVLSASSVSLLHAGKSGWSYFVRQAIWSVLGAMTLVAGMRISLPFVRRMIPVALFVGYGLMVAVLVPGIGRKVNDARAWIGVGPISIQPAEVMKLVLAIYCADLFARRADRMHEVRATLRPALMLLMGAAVLALAQPDLGGAIVLATIVLSSAFIAGAPMVPLATVGLLGTAGASLVMLSSSTRRDRWIAFLDLAKHKKDIGFQVWQSRVGIASGGLSGVGLGASKAKWGFLPEAHTDFIFSIVAEELGLIGVVIVVALFLLLGLFGVQVALRAQDRFSMVLAGGITSWLLVQAIINIGGVIGIMPLTGLTLPFVSFGGSSLLVTMAAAGLLLNISRSAR
jgi:cell division protein FtsW